MAPNNALAANSSPKALEKNENNKAASAVAVTATTTATSATSVLSRGTVSSRGTGTTHDRSPHRIAREIQDFLHQQRYSVRAETRAFFTVWTFVTRLPGPTWTDHHPGFLMLGMAYFPWAGCLVGGWVAVWYDATLQLLDLTPSLAAVACTAASLWVTGCFHEDGLADASDGIGGGWSRREILTIMTDTRLGTYGCAVLMLYLLAKVQLLTALGPSEWGNSNGSAARGAGPALVLSHTLARLTAPYMIRTRDYVDETGPKNQFYTYMVQAKHLVSWNRVGLAMLTSFTVASWLVGPHRATVLVMAVLVAAHMAGAYGEYLLGGVMGDFLGATICVTEILVLTMVYIMGQQPDFGSVLPSSWEEWTALATNPNWRKWIVNDSTMHPKLRVLLRFALIMLVTVVWCRNVGHPNVLVRDTVVHTKETEVSNGTSDGDEVRIGLSCGNGVEPDTNTTTLPQPETSAVGKEGSTLTEFATRYEAARSYLDTLAKPVGSLGTLEDWAARLVALQSSGSINNNNQQQQQLSGRSCRVQVDPVACLIFAGDHGAAKAVEDGGAACSLYPQSVTRSILAGLQRGIAGASVLARQNNITCLRVVDVGVVSGQDEDDLYRGPIVFSSPFKLMGGTRNLCQEAAMTVYEAEQCIAAGRQGVVDVVNETKAKVLVLGEVGIGNTTSTSALAALLLSSTDISEVCGGGATMSRSVDQQAVQRKTGLVQQAVKRHAGAVNLDIPIQPLAAVGGTEIAALVGAFLECSDRNLAVLCDGFIVSVAALVALRMDPAVARILLLTTRSAEPGHAKVLEKLRERGSAADHSATNCDAAFMPPPALDMGLRMGEGTAGLLAVPLLRSAAAVWNDMGTIEDILGNTT